MDSLLSVHAHLPSTTGSDLSLTTTATTAPAPGLIGAEIRAGRHDPANEADPESSTADPQDTVAPWMANVKRRAPIACRRCRRMRSKCTHDKAQPPCEPCKEAGLGAADCEFPVRGQPGNDREYRHPRHRNPRPSRSDSVVRARNAAPRPAKLADEWDHMPPLDDIVDAVDRFTKHYFQLGFIPKQQFRDKLQNDHRSISIFLVLAILSISARMTPALIKEHGSGVKAAEHFMDRACKVASDEIHEAPTLERCQAFYLLSLAQQGNGLKNRSYLNVGIATRMSTLMRLHREETYEMQNPTKESIISAESARRTMWMLHSQDSLHSGTGSPVALGAPDITALLPCEEEDFAAGVLPKSRAALPDSPPAIDQPALVRDSGRSLFASLMQVNHYWGLVSRRAASLAKDASPWDSQSQFSIMQKRIHDWEIGLPVEHRWATPQLHYYKYRGLDQAYLSVTMMPRLCHIVLRRAYLNDILNIERKGPRERKFFGAVAADLFQNVHDLFKQIDAQFTGRALEESVGAQITTFCVYVCGLLSTYLCKYPQICLNDAIKQDGPLMLKRAKEILLECKQVWPLASRWVSSIERVYEQDDNAAIATVGSMADGKDPVPEAWLKRSREAPPTPKGEVIRPAALKNAKAEVRPDAMMGNYPDNASAFSPALPPMHSDNMYRQSSGFPVASVQAQPSMLAQSTPPATAFGQNVPLQSVLSSSPTQMYMPPPNGPGTMLMGSFVHPQAPHYQPAPHQAHPQSHQQAPAYGMAPNGAFYPQPGPGNDGFENELQVYMGGNNNNGMAPGGWDPSMH